MFFRLFLIFAIVPVIELSLLIKVGTLIGTLNTVVLVITTAMVGSYLVRMEGINVIYRFQQNMQEGIFPAEEILDGAMILVAGCLLVTPGILTDIIGFSFVFPMSRMAIKRLLRRYIDKKIATMNVRIHRP
jgi:UPF0716 protein FxsA